MKKVAILICVTCILLVGCETKGQNADSLVLTKSFPEIVEPHNADQAEQSGDVVVLMDGMRNRDKWKTFVKNVKNKQQDQVRVTNYSVEGQPIIHELIYDGEVIETTFDDSRDMYGSKQGIITNSCKGIGTTKSGMWRTFYVLTECEKAGTFSIRK